MFQFQSFGSGSSGNAYVIRTDGAQIMIDAGVRIRKLRKMLREYGVSTGKIDGILVTHNHIDHVRSLGILSSKDKVRVFLTEGTLKGIRSNPRITKKPNPDTTTLIEKGKPFMIGDVEVTAFSVPHDAVDNVGYMLRHNKTHFCLVTDCGHWTEEIDAYVKEATHLVVESNYDEQMLTNGPYPIFLQNRIRSNHGHLSNPEAADVIRRHGHHLRNIWLCHLSDHNNTHTLALQNALDAWAETTGDKTATPDANNQSTAHLSTPSPQIIALEREKPSPLYDLEGSNSDFGNSDNDIEKSDNIAENSGNDTGLSGNDTGTSGNDTENSGDDLSNPIALDLFS